jgi:glycerol-3-phosphate dehydrogenase (NAD(P)+)
MHNDRYMRVAVVGSGSWGIALALRTAQGGHSVRLYGRPGPRLEELASRRESALYLPGHPLPEAVMVTPIAADAGWGEAAIVAVPSHAVAEAAQVVRDCPNLILASKGIERASGRLLSGIVHEVCPDSTLTVLGGPNLAMEVAKGTPTVAVVASRDAAACEAARCLLMGPMFRVYLSDDVVGVQLAGALKNVVAIAAGMSDGLGFGDNTKAAVVSRGLNEMARIGLAMGARLETFVGAAGVGDLFATCSSRLSRNYRVGLGLGEGRALKEVVAELGQVAEGVATSRSAVALADSYGISVPIMNVVKSVVDDGLSPRVAVGDLMAREAKPEWPVLVGT